VPKGTVEQVRQFMYDLKVFQFGVGWGGFESLVINITVGYTPEQAEAVDCQSTCADPLRLRRCRKPYCRFGASLWKIESVGMYA
jgi:hypothetical protein